MRKNHIFPCKYCDTLQGAPFDRDICPKCRRKPVKRSLGGELLAQLLAEFRHNGNHSAAEQLASAIQYGEFESRVQAEPITVGLLDQILDECCCWHNGCDGHRRLDGHICSRHIAMPEWYDGQPGCMTCQKELEVGSQVVQNAPSLLYFCSSDCATAHRIKEVTRA